MDISKGTPPNPTDFTRLRIKDDVLSAESSKLPDEHRFSWVGRNLRNNAHFRIPHRVDTNPFADIWGNFHLHLSAIADVIPANFIQISCIFQLQEWSFATPFAGHSQEGPGRTLSLRCHCSSSFGQTEALHLCRWFDAW